MVTKGGHDLETKPAATTNAAEPNDDILWVYFLLVLFALFTIVNN